MAARAPLLLISGVVAFNVASATGCHQGGSGTAAFFGSVTLGEGRYQGTDDFEAYATFSSGAFPDYITGQIPPLGECVVDTNGYTIDAPSGWHTLDAGPSLNLATPIGSMTLVPDAYLDYHGTASSQAFAPETHYALSGVGGADVRAFNADLITPSDLVVTQPDMTGVVPVSRTSGLSVQWTSQGGTDPVEVFVGQLPISTFTLPGVTCLFPDGGSAFVPGSLFGAPFELGSAFTTTVSVEKFRLGSFDAPPFGPVETVTVSVWNADATIVP